MTYDTIEMLKSNYGTFSCAMVEIGFFVGKHIEYGSWIEDFLRAPSYSRALEIMANILADKENISLYEMERLGYSFGVVLNNYQG